MRNYKQLLSEALDEPISNIGTKWREEDLEEGPRGCLNCETEVDPAHSHGWCDNCNALYCVECAEIEEYCGRCYRFLSVEIHEGLGK